MLCQATGQLLPGDTVTYCCWPLGNGQQAGQRCHPSASIFTHALGRADKHENSTVCKLLEPRGGTHGKGGLGPHGAARDKVRRMNGKGAATPDNPTLNFSLPFLILCGSWNLLRLEEGPFEYI